MKKIFKCKRCDTEFSAKHHLIKHLSRKIVCIPIHESNDVDILILIEELNKKPKTKFKCVKCLKYFSTKQNLQRHLDNVCKHNYDVLEEFNNVNDFQSYVNKIETRLNNLETQSKFTSQIFLNNNINIQNNIVNIKINNFGEEQLEHLTTQFLDKCLLEYKSGVTKLLKEIHFNPNIPENHNIRPLSKKQNTLELFSDGVWHPCDKNNTLDKMIRNGYKILFRHFLNTRIDNNITEEEEQRNEYINEYLTKIMRKEGNIYYELRRDLYMLILDGEFYIIGK